MIQSLQSLRGLFALMIFFHHFYYPGGGAVCPPGGDCGVAFFLILSGFVMSDGYAVRALSPKFSYIRFMGLRLARLWPLHLLCLVAALLLYRHGYLPALVLNALMLQSWVPEPLYYFSGNAVAWCLADLMFCYAVFPYLLRAIHKHARRCFLIFIIVSGAVLAYGLWFCPQGLVVPIMYISPATRVLDFCLGIFLWKARRRLLKCTPRGGVLISILLLAGCCAAYAHVNIALGSAMLWWIPLSLLILFCSLPCGWMTERLMNSRVLVAFGNVSFSFYMIHVLAGEYLQAAFAVLGMDIQWGLFLALDLAMCVVLAFACHRYFEKPIDRKLRNIIAKSAS